MQTKSNQPKLTGLDLGRRNGGRGAPEGKIFDDRAENGEFDLRRRGGQNGCSRGGDINGRGFHLAVGEHGDGAFVTSPVRVVVNQPVQRRASRQGIEKQNQRNQQSRDCRFAKLIEMPPFA
jgi:hypothetical protein